MIRLACIAALISLSASASFAQVPERIHWQAVLTDDAGQPIDGAVDLSIRLYTSRTGGSAAYTKDTTGVLANQGVVAVPLGPLPGVSFGGPLFLGVSVNGGDELAPRSPLASVPYALSLRGLRIDRADDTYNQGVNVIAGASNNTMDAGVVGGTIGGGGGDVDGEDATNRVAFDFGTVGGGFANTAAGEAGTVAGGARNSAAGYAAVGGGEGNSADAFGSNVAGGQGNLASSGRAAVGGGYSNNAVGEYATVSGGDRNTAGADHSTVGGGRQNGATGLFATVAGGDNGTAGGTGAAIGGGVENTASSSNATVSGGGHNVAEGSSSTVGGGWYNAAGGSSSAVGGGSNNTVTGNIGVVSGGQGNTASGDRSTVGGGRNNAAGGAYSTIGGGGPSDTNDATNTNNRVYDDYGTIGGGGGNRAGNDDGNASLQIFATVGGGRDNVASGRESTIGGGLGNEATARFAAVGGGWTNTAGFWSSTVAGGVDNLAGGGGATVAGGSTNHASAPYATISGGGPSDPNSPSTTNNRIFDGYGTIGGGGGNRVGNDDGDTSVQVYATVGGGLRNEANAAEATVGGGGFNWAGGVSATVAGGSENQASGNGSSVGGGNNNVASGERTAIGGGMSNGASGDYSAVPGGQHNHAGGVASFAGGTEARANHDGVFVWADRHVTEFASTDPNQFLVRAYGGMRVVRGASTHLSTQAALQVEQSDTDGEAAWFKQRTAATAPVVSLLKVPASTNHFLAGYTQASDGGTPTGKFHIQSDGAYVAGSDMAEALPAVGNRSDYESGDVLVISRSHPGSVEQSTRPHDTAVIGVYSTRPGFLGADKNGSTEILPNDVPVAIAGIVPVKASAENGPIRAGDLLATSGTVGHAMRAEPVVLNGVSFHPSGVVIGKAMGPLEQGTGIIRMFVMCQ